MIRLIADSTCDLSPELRKRYGVDILPLNTNLGSRAYTDGVDITPEELYAWSDETKETPKTAVFSLEQAKDKFRPYLAQGDELICFSISESMSASGQVMRLAANELHAGDRIHVIDSQNLSTGIGLLVLMAADLIQKGLPAAEVVRQTEAARPFVRSSFIVDTMTYLHRGGRCSGAVALTGNLLRIHPRIVVENGAMHADKKYRGRLNHVLMEYAEDLKPSLEHARKNRVFVTHSGCDQEIEDSIVQFLADMHHFGEIHVTRAGSVISSHCGPNTLGILFITE